MTIPVARWPRCCTQAGEQFGRRKEPHRKRFSSPRTEAILRDALASCAEVECEGGGGGGGGDGGSPRQGRSIYYYKFMLGMIE